MTTKFAALYLCVVGNSVALKIQQSTHLLDTSVLEHHIANTSVQPSIAIIVLGNQSSPRPVWATPEHDVFIYAPPQNCSDCPDWAQPKPGSRMWKNKGWWCAQRHFFAGLEELIDRFPRADFYLTVDADTMVFPHALRFLLQHIILNEAHDVFIGHATESDPHLVRFIETGGGALMRGRTLRRLAHGGYLDVCQKKVQGDWCWHHLDWALSECFLLMNVFAHGHQGFNQGPFCDGQVVTCHPVKALDAQINLLKQHENISNDSFNASWAQPCPDDQYDFRDTKHSKCKTNKSQESLARNETFSVDAMYSDSHNFYTTDFGNISH